MKINRLKINRFGKLNNKEINFDNNINIIYGKNESGKSTLLKFIINSLYGISKNKKGKDISDYDQYTPWIGEEFSGKIEYELDNKEKYEIYRDFKKKNPNIYNENHEDISKKFNIDKNKGNEFFEEQTNINEETFLSTFAIIQKEVKIEKNVQNILIQKISNTISTGKQNISFKKAIERINKRQIEEIGSQRTREKPANIIPKEIENIEIKQKELENLKKEAENMINIKDKIIEDSKHNQIKYEILKDIKILKNNQNIENEKIKIKNNIIINDENKIKNIYEEIKNIKKEKNNFIIEEKINKKLIINSIIFILINILQFILIKNKLFNYIFLLTAAGILIFYYFYKKLKIKNNNLLEKEEKNNKINELNNEIKIIEKNKIEIKNEIEKNKIEINLKNNLEKEKLKNKYKNKINESELNKLINNENLESEIEKLENELNEDKIKIETINIELKNIDPKLTESIELEEQKYMLQQKLANINKENKSMEIAKEVLENAYNIMKNNINPKFIEKISKNISEITDGKYKNILFNEEDGLI